MGINPKLSLTGEEPRATKETADTIFQHGQHEGFRTGQLASPRFASGDWLQSQKMEIVVFSEDLGCC
ncbi:MAG: hypothetical protein ACHQ9S_17270 [Candidatus Binatia bacterium]